MVQPINIANGTGYPLLVTVRNDRKKCLTGSQDIRQPFSSTSGILRIKPGTYVQFVPQESNSNVSFVSMAALEKSGTEIITEAFEIVEGRNIVVGHDKQVHLTRPGCTWVDESGHHHWLCSALHFPVITTSNEDSKMSA